MTLPQWGSLALIAVAIGFFIWGRIRYDLVALGALLAGVVTGLIAPDQAFTGFGADVVVIIGAALVVSAAVARSGIMERLLRPVLNRLGSARTQVPALTLAVGVMSMVTKNVGALAMFMPVALQLSRRTGTNASCLLMPMAFASLLGGLVTLVGTSPNILVSGLRQELLGRPFALFDYAPVGLVVAAAGFVFLAFGYRLLPGGRKGAVSLTEALESAEYTVEVAAPADVSKMATPADLHALSGGSVRVAGIVRSSGSSAAPLPDAEIRPGDRLLLRGEQAELDGFLRRAKLDYSRVDDDGAEEPEEEETGDELSSSEMVVGLRSPLVGRSANELALKKSFGVDLLALSRSGERLTESPRSARFRPGDLLVLKGTDEDLADAARDLALLPLAARPIRLGRRGHMATPLAILVIAVALVGFGVLPVAIAFFAAALAVVAVGALPLREAYESLDGPVLVLVAALIPVSDTVRSTGATEVLGGLLSQGAVMVPPLAALTLTIAIGMAVTPFLNNAATVLVLGPVVAVTARQLNLNPDPFLMAVALGAACDFLTPIGHQCNTLVFGPGGYRFTDYFRLGAPLSLLVLAIGTPMIAWVWPLAG